MKSSSLFAAIILLALVSHSGCSRTGLSAEGDLDPEPPAGDLDGFACADAELEPLEALIIAGSTVGLGNELTGSCGGEEAEEVALVWTAPATGTYAFDTIGSTFDTMLYAFDGGCDADEMACNDDIGNGDGASEIYVAVRAGTPIVIVVDGFDGAAGDFRLSIRRMN